MQQKTRDEMRESVEQGFNTERLALSEETDRKGSKDGSIKDQKKSMPGLNQVLNRFFAQRRRLFDRGSAES